LSSIESEVMATTDESDREGATRLARARQREVRAPRGTEMTCATWQAEAALRMLMNNLDPEVAEDPERLVVYGGRGQAARSWAAFDAIVASLQAAGKPTRRCSCSRASRSASCGRTRTRRGC
jgi:hypothetical protein